MYVIDLPHPAPTVEGTLDQVMTAADAYRAAHPDHENGFALWERVEGELVAVYGLSFGGHYEGGRVYV